MKRGEIKHKFTKKSTKEEEKRPLRTRKYKQFFLVVCEDEATEPAYFRQFKDEFDKISPETMFFEVVGTGKDQKGVVEQAIQERNNLKQEHNKEIDFVWAVFDKDDADKNAQKTKNFEDAFALAKQENIQLAYSNEVFELWLLLHLTNVPATTPIPRADIYQMLQDTVQKSGSLYQNYIYNHQKDKAQILKIITQIGNEAQAIKKAEKLLLAQQGKKPIDANPSTKVHLLVIELRKWLDWYKK